MADIQVGLKVKFDKADAAKAGKDMADAVKGAASSGANSDLAHGVKGLPPTSQERASIFQAELRRRRMTELRYDLAQQKQKDAAIANAAALGRMAMAVTAVIATIRGFGIVTSSISNAMNRASTFYAKSLTSGGMPLGFTTQKSIIAQAMGVSENEVLHYGKAFNYLNNEMHSSIAIQAANAKLLTESSYKWKAGGESLRSFFSTIAHGIKSLGGDSVVGVFNRMVSALNEKMNKSWDEVDKMKFAVEFRSSKGLDTNTGFKNLFDIIQNKISPAGSFHLKTKGEQLSETMGSKEFNDAWKKRQGILDPVTSAKRYQTSNWERMGLVIGQGVNSNPLRATEQNTRSAAVTLKEIRSFLAPRSMNGGPAANKVPNRV